MTCSTLTAAPGRRTSTWSSGSWTGDYRPRPDTGLFHDLANRPEQRLYWSNAQYDKLAVEQASAVDPQQRKNIIWQMQQIMYQQSPWILADLPRYLEAVNTAKWTGWTQMFDGTGPAWQCEGNITSYLDLRPAALTATTSGSSSTTLIVVVVIIVVVAAGIAFVFVRRRRGRRVEDEA